MMDELKKIIKEHGSRFTVRCPICQNDSHFNINEIPQWRELVKKKKGD